MASVRFITTLVSCAALLVSIPSSQALTCTSQNFTNAKTFESCVDLPELDAYLHYTYNSTNSSLSIAFVAEPAEPEGWIAWGINPKSDGMIGTQALLAYKEDSIVVETYDITSYSLKESNLTFDVWNLGGESSGDNFVIFASMTVPEGATEVNQVWQNGASVTNGSPGKHEMSAENTKAKGVLKLSGGAPAPGPAGVSDTSSTPANAGRKLNVGSCVGVIVLIVSFFGF